MTTITISDEGLQQLAAIQAEINQAEEDHKQAEEDRDHNRVQLDYLQNNEEPYVGSQARGQIRSALTLDEPLDWAAIGPKVDELDGVRNQIARHRQEFNRATEAMAQADTDRHRLRREFDQLIEAACQPQAEQEQQAKQELEAAKTAHGQAGDDLVYASHIATKLVEGVWRTKSTADKRSQASVQKAREDVLQAEARERKTGAKLQAAKGKLERALMASAAAQWQIRQQLDRLLDQAELVGA